MSVDAMQPEVDPMYEKIQKLKEMHARQQARTIHTLLSSEPKESEVSKPVVQEKKSVNRPKQDRSSVNRKVSKNPKVTEEEKIAKILDSFDVDLEEDAEMENASKRPRTLTEIQRMQEEEKAPKSDRTLKDIQKKQQREKDLRAEMMRAGGRSKALTEGTKEQFDIIRDFVRENGGANALTIEKATGIPRRVIDQFIQNDMLGR